MYKLHKVASLLTRFRLSINAISAWLRKGIAHFSILGSLLMEYVYVYIYICLLASEVG